MKQQETIHQGRIVDRAAGFSVVDCSTGRFAIALSHRDGAQQLTSFFSLSSRSWDCDPHYVSGVRVVPWGPDDQMPRMVRDLLERNNIGPGTLQRKMGLIYGEGLRLYRLRVTDEGEITRQWTTDQHVEEWLRSWDSRRYVREALQEYLHMNGHFTRYHMGKAVRIGIPWIASLDCLPSTDCRLVWPDEQRTPCLADIRHVLYGDMERWRQLELLPIFDKWQPTSHEVAVAYHSLRSFGRKLYAVSSFHGSIPWMQDANDIAEIVRALNDNVIAAAYIVHEPQQYWQEKRMQLEQDHPEWTDQQIAQKLDQLRDNITQQIADVMAGKQNAGKFFTCVDFVDEQGRQQSWRIEPIELNLDKYIQAQKDIARLADSATTSAMGLSPALSNIIIDGKSDSGSQMLYALKIFYAADTRIAEDIALEAINDALHINFPDKPHLHLGFYHKTVEKEDNVTAADRMVNQ